MRALILVDIQNDFLPGGALAVNEGDAVVPVANALVERYELVVATQDWHPANHRSFAVNNPGHQVGEVIDLDGLSQILWPAHCVQGSAGASFASALAVAQIDAVFQKGTDIAIDSYSGFFDNGQRKATGLDAFLRGKGVDEVHLLGLATDYCVKFTALDARKLGLKTSLVLDGCRGVELSPGDVDAALAELRAAGVRVCSSNEFYR